MLPPLLEWLRLPLHSDTSYLKHSFAVRTVAMLGDSDDVAELVAAAAAVDSDEFDEVIAVLVEEANEEQWSTLLPFPAARLWVVRV